MDVLKTTPTVGETSPLKVHRCEACLPVRVDACRSGPEAATAEVARTRGRAKTVHVYTKDSVAHSSTKEHTFLPPFP